MLRLLILGLALLSNTALTSSHICKCADELPHFTWEHGTSAAAYTTLFVLSGFLFIRHLLYGSEEVIDREIEVI